MLTVKHLIVVCFLLSPALAKLKLSSLVEVCSEKDPKLDGCAKKAAEVILPRLAAGIPEYGIKGVDPFQVPFMSLSLKGLKFNITDANHDGLATINFKRVKLDLPHFKTYVESVVPRYSVQGNCHFSGKLIGLPLTGHGPCNLTSLNHDLNLVVHLGVRKIKDVEHLTINKLETKFKFTKGLFDIQGLFNGNKLLGEETNRILNERSVDVLNEMKGKLEELWGAIFLKVLQGLLDSVPANEILLA